MIYLASYRGRQTGFMGFIARLIRWFDLAEFTHSEVCIGNPFMSAVTCVSASGMDGGVRAKVMQLDPAKWDLLPMPWVTDAAVMRWLESNRDGKHDGLSVMRFLVPGFLREHQTRWANAEAAADMAGFAQPWRFTPQMLYVLTETLLERYYTELYRLHKVEQVGALP